MDFKVRNYADALLPGDVYVAMRWDDYICHYEFVKDSMAYLKIIIRRDETRHLEKMPWRNPATNRHILYALRKAKQMTAEILEECTGGK